MRSLTTIHLPVSGTVSAQQNGPWNVGILGQPLGVNINNSPTVGLAAGTTVVSRNADDPSRVAYESTVDMTGMLGNRPLKAGSRFIEYIQRAEVVLGQP